MEILNKVVFIAFGSVALASAASAGGSSKPTYAKDIAPILNENCVVCHRPGETAPMSLTTYDEVRPWAKAIAKNVGERIMPPWHADKGIGVFSNDRSLDDDKIATIVRWVDQGATRGELKDLPPSPTFPTGDWKLGPPDLEIAFKKVDLPAGGPDQFFNLEHTLDLPSDRWVRAVEIRPTNRKVTHHVIVYQTENLDTPPNGWLGAWAAGAEPMQFPEGTGRLVKKNGILIGDMHYHPADSPQSEETRIGLHFAADSSIKKEVVNLWLDNRTFEIPAGNPSFTANSTFSFPQDSVILSVMPHMHYRGRSFKYVATYPNGRSDVLMSTSNYDFNWQTNYVFKKPIKVPRGTQIECVAEWDNSADNPRNPDPTKNVKFGSASTDEMMIGFVDYVVKDGTRPESPTDQIAKILAELAAAHPGDVYEATLIDNAPDPRPAPSALYLPREGEGTWQIAIDGRLFDGTLTALAWQDNAVTARAKMGVLGTSDFAATIDAATGKIDGTISEKNAVLAEFHGTRVK